MKNILITGAAGFIGSNFVEYFIKKYKEKYNVIILDKLTYAGNLHNLDNIKDKITFVKEDICNFKGVEECFKKNSIDTVIHFAAESHVDTSIKTPLIFAHTNIIGTNVMLEVARQIWGTNSDNKFLHISTDEVYGSLSTEKLFTEDSQIKPNSPYAASKASSDLIVLAYSKTYDMNTSIINSSNNYGPYQFHEKLIPLMISLAIQNKPLTLYGNGQNIRDWLYVVDNCKAIDLVLNKGKKGERYNVGGNEEKSNIEVAETILDYLGKPKNQIAFIEDRKGHDYRYAMDYKKIEEQLGWRPQTEFRKGIEQTIEWYLKHSEYLLK